MSKLDLSKVDLNLLVVLDVLLTERSVAVAADRLNLTPSAISHALRRLRDQFDNELLVRDGKVMMPTTRALEIAKSLPIALEYVRRAMEPPEPFDAMRSARTFRLAVPDFVTPVIPHILQAKGDEAQNIQLEFMPFSQNSFRDLGDGKCDVVIASISLNTPEHFCRPLGEFPWKVFGRAGHPAFKNWSLKSWLAYPHLQVRIGGSSARGPIDVELEKLGLQRTISATIPLFSISAPVLSRTNFLLVVPAVAMSGFAEAYNLECREPPISLTPFQPSVFRSVAFGDEPAIAWLEDLVADAYEML